MTLAAVIPTKPVPAQVIQCTLGNQRVRIQLQQRPTGLFADVYLADVLVIAGMLCRVGVNLFQSSYLGFVGNLAFFDTQSDTPGLIPGTDTGRVSYQGLGGRYFLGYLT